MTTKEFQYKDGVYENVPMEEYKTWPAAHYSALRILADGQTPASYKSIISTEQQETSNMTAGRFMHLAILQPELLKKMQPLPAGVRRGTKEFANLSSEDPTIIWHNQSEWARIEGYINAGRCAAENIRRHAVASELMANIKTEVSLLWHDKETGVLCKGRIDALGPNNTIVDIKTTSRRIPYDIVRAGFFYGYHIQAAMYTDGLQLLRNLQDRPKFFFIFVDNAPPYDVLVANAHSAYDERNMTRGSSDYYEIGRMAYQQALKTVAKCAELNDWPGYPENIIDMTIPRGADLALPEIPLW